MNRKVFYSSIKYRLIKVALVQVFLGLMEMVNVLIIYKIISYSIYSIQNNQEIILIEIGEFYEFNITFIILLISAFLYVIIKFIISVIFTVFKNNSITSITESISNEVFSTYINMSFKKLNAISTSSILQNIRGESVFLTRYLSSIILVFYESFTVIGLAILLFYIDVTLTLFVSVLILMFGTVFILLVKDKLIRWGALRHKYETKLINQIMQTFDGIREVIVYGKKTLFTNFFKKVNYKKFNIEAKNLNYGEAPRFFLEFLFGASIFILLYYFSKIEIKTYNFESLIIFALAAYRILPGVNRILNSIQSINYNKKSVEKIKNILNEKLIINKKQKKPLINQIKKINFENVFFSHDSKTQIFKNLNKEININSIFGLHGPSGSGKSTFIDLVSGLIFPDSGLIKVNGKNITHDIHSYQQLISYVSQSPYMLNGSLIENVIFENENHINEKFLIDCCVSANIDFVKMNIKEMRSFKINEGGTNISGGQKQRIAIARALYKKPQILILDEFTSALDDENEELLLETIEKISNGKIIIIVSHKKSTLKICNELVELKKI